jgi:hypothetical protein
MFVQTIDGMCVARILYPDMQKITISNVTVSHTIANPRGEACHRQRRCEEQSEAGTQQCRRSLWRVAN